jgi:uncharacterized membrane protein YccC
VSSTSIRARRPLRRHAARAAVAHSLALATACYVSYWFTTRALTRVHSLSAADDLLGGMWAVIATVFVYSTTHQEDVAAALSRAAATGLSFALCLIYLLILPFSPVGLVVLIGVGTLILTVIGRSGDTVTAGITTAVVMVVAGLTPHDAWQQPILRIIDTAVGVSVGLAAVSIGSGVRRRRSS